jgi:hypothetical protein
LGWTGGVAQVVRVPAKQSPVSQKRKKEKNFKNYLLATLNELMNLGIDYHCPLIGQKK